MYISKDTLSGHLSEFTVDSPVADGVWHVFSLISNGQNTFLLLDGKPVLNITDRSMDLTPVSVEKIIFGAALTGDRNLQQSGKYTVIIDDNLIFFGIFMCEPDIKRHFFT